MKKMNQFYLLATLALVATLTVSCSHETQLPIDDPASAPEETAAPETGKKIITLVATLSPKTGIDTKALTESGSKIESSWAVNEEVCVEYTNGSDDFVDAKGIITAVDGSGNATITVDLVNPKDGDTEIYFHYPYCIAAGSKDLKTDQIGTLADISANFDEMTGDGMLSVSGGVATLSAGVTMNRNVSIWKLAFTSGGDPITGITAVNIKVGDIREIDVNPATPLDEVYVALYSCSSQTITITAATATNTYSYSKAGVSLANGKFYRSTVAMSAAVASNTYRVYSDRTSFDNVDIPVGAVVVTSETATWSDNTYVVNSNVTIDGNVSVTGDAILVLCDGAALTVNGTITGSGTLSIYGQSLSTGKLDVIYGDINVSLESIAIHGGIITVTEGGVMQGIEAMNLDIYHGKVTTAGAVNGFMVMGDMHIYGGEIIATATNGSALQIYGAGTPGRLTMTGGTFSAIGNGSGSYNKGILVEEGSGAGTASITVSGGTLIVTGGSAPDDSNAGAVAIDVQGTLTISGTANVTANGGTDTYACAGGGYAIEVRTGSTAGGNATISGGTLTATGGFAMAGLSIYYLTINGGDVTVNGGSNGEGILANVEGSYPDFTKGTVTINGGVLRANGGECCSGIGSRITSVTGGVVYAYGGDSGMGIEGDVTLTGVTMYEGDAPDPSVAAASQTACTKRYVKIQ